MTNTHHNNDTKLKGLAKYRSLILLATSFFGLVAVLSGVTYLTTNKIANATKELELASQQTILVQQLSKNLLDLNLYLNDLTNQDINISDTTVFDPEQQALPHGTYSLDLLPQTGIYQLEEIGKQTQTFTNMLNALKHGGVAQDVLGNAVNINTVTDPKLKKILDEIETIWTPFLGLLNNFVNDTKQGIIKKQTSDYLVDYARQYNLSLQAETIEFSGRQNELIQSVAHQLRLGQIGGISVAFLLFLAIVFGSLRQLVRTDKQLAVAQKQTDDIMHTVNEGLFLIDKNLIISDQHSAKLEEILHKQNIAGQNLYDILEGMISEKDMGTTKRFIEQLYNIWVVEELIQDLNPLKQVSLSYIADNGVPATKFLAFNFLRVLDEGTEDIKSVFVSVTDITKEVNLQNQMQKDKEQHNRQIEMISYLLSVDGSQLTYFINETKGRIERMNDVLKNQNTDNPKAKAQLLYREMHSLKGDASAVNLNALVDIAHRQETTLKQLLEHTDLKGNDFLPFTIGLNEMMDMVSFIESLIGRLNIGSNPQNLPNLDVPTNNAQTTQPPKDHWQGYFTQYANDIAKRQNKQIKVHIAGFDEVNIPNDLMSAYKDIATQLLKNAIVHGIENTEERTHKNKDITGQITLNLSEDAKNQKLTIKDDGAGINWEKIRQKAVEIGQATTDTAHNLTQKDLVRIMFLSGVSTAKTVDEDAGRGVGMDIIKALANKYHAKIGVSSKADHFTQISITFPKDI
ncbi:MAG: ATP-binding protein [Moraxella sp.]|uniref:ATP-binding protein n=1 Tax=Moraxella sp. TaxID=479 RepID=UPI0026DA7970|nr:ATP-binding protein [Moraxella sp.]MDO4450606.1 ATP-binding protein [Moraxella sp.]